VVVEDRLVGAVVRAVPDGVARRNREYLLFRDHSSLTKTEIYTYPELRRRWRCLIGRQALLQGIPAKLKKKFKYNKKQCKDMES